MDINILGSGYVGLTLGIFIANQGFKVNMIDIDQSKIDKLKLGISPVHETGIQEALDFSIKSKNIKEVLLHLSDLPDDFFLRFNCRALQILQEKLKDQAKLVYFIKYFLQIN